MSMSEWRSVKNRDEITMDTFTHINRKIKKVINYGKNRGGGGVFKTYDII
jgi:hypothetical protein